jgi:hypothetical protein
MLQREADRNDYRKTDDGTSTVTTNKTKNYVTSHIIDPRQQSDVNWFTNTVRCAKADPGPRCGRAPGNCRPGTQASGKLTIFAHAQCFDRRRDQEIVDVAFAFASTGLRDFALSMFFCTPLRRGLSLDFAGWREDEMDRAAKSLRRVILAG